MAASWNRVLLVAATLTTPAQLCLAQAQPQREDNRWGGLSHQPTQSEVQQREQAAGIARSQQQ